MGESLQYDVPVIGNDGNVYLLKKATGWMTQWELFCNGGSIMKTMGNPPTMEDGVVCFVSPWSKVRMFWFNGYPGPWSNRTDIFWGSGWYFKEALAGHPSWVNPDPSKWPKPPSSPPPGYPTGA